MTRRPHRADDGYEQQALNERIRPHLRQTDVADLAFVLELDQYPNGLGIGGVGLVGRLLVLEDSRCDPADALGVGDRVDLDDLALGDSEAHHGHGLSTQSDDDSGRSVHQRGAQVDDRAREE
jgi:hypothetical protein